MPGFLKLLELKLLLEMHAISTPS